MRSTPPYARIAADIRADIRSGKLSPGDRVPSAREITRRWGVAIATATKVLAALRGEGLVRPVPGVGTVVAGVGGNGDPGRTGRAPARVGRTRTAERALDLDAVVTAAIGVADVEGGTGFSMRRLAAELGVSAMALYRHVQGKPDLLRAMAGRAFSEDPLPEAPEDWRRGLELAARREWEIYQRHPWVLEIVSLHRPLMIDSMVEHTEWSLGLLRRAGAEPDLALWAVVSLHAYTMGMAGQAGIVHLLHLAMPRQEVGHLDGWGRGKYDGGGALYHMRSRGNTGAKTLSWTLRGKGVATVRIGSCRTGWITKRVEVG